MALGEEDDAAGADGRDFAFDPDSSGAGDDVDEFLTIGVRVGRFHGAAWLDADDAGGALVRSEQFFVGDPAEVAPGEALFFGL